MTDQRAIQLQQLANIVIDAYLNREKQYIPKFRPGVKAVMFPNRPRGSADHPGLRTNFWYDRSDYEPTVTARAQETNRSSKK